MDLLKQDRVMNEIIYSITHGEKGVGDMVFSRDHDLASKQMAKIFKKLSEKGIIQQTVSNSYALTEECFNNAQEFYFEKIAEIISQIKMLAETANISYGLLIDVFKEEMKTDV